MTPRELEIRASALLGPTWQTRLAEGLRTTDRAVRFYAAGDRPIPGPVVAALELLEHLVAAGAPVPPPWRLAENARPAPRARVRR